MSDFSLTLVLHFKTSKIINGMAKVQIKSERITPFGGIFQVREQFSRYVGPVIDKVLGLRCTSFGYQSIITEKWEGKAYRLVIQRERRLDGEQDLWEGDYTYRCILTNDYTSTNREIVEFYNLRGGKERIFDDMNNGFGWARLPKSFMAENTVFLLLTALIRNFYKFLMDRLDTKAFGLKKTSRIKAFVFKFISVPAKWIRTARHYELNIYTDNKSYQNPFAFTDG